MDVRLRQPRGQMIIASVLARWVGMFCALKLATLKRDRQKLGDPAGTNILMFTYGK
jgi:hypothetical protein